jgi:endonuclease/exonuclease/phosphatase (EEP) superfamily protein YafD
MASSRPGLRVVACDVRGLRGADLESLAALIRPLGADVVVVHGAPWRIRARARSAALADRFGLFYGAGGAASVGNLVLVSVRVSVPEAWCVRYPLVPGRRMRAAALARCTVPGGSFVVAATELAPPGPATDAERSTEAGILSRVLSKVDEPVILVGNVAGTTLTAGRVDAAAHGSSAGSILVGPGIAVGARHYARRSMSTTRLPIMVDLLLPSAAVKSG